MEAVETGANSATMPRITLPDFVPITPEELDRRRRLVERVRALRDEIGPIEMRVDDLIHEVRGGDDRFDE